MLCDICSDDVCFTGLRNNILLVRLTVCGGLRFAAATPAIYNPILRHLRRSHAI